MGTNNSEGRMVNEIPILGHILYGISSSYGSIMRRRHRGFISHFPYISTIIRLIFILFIPFVLLDSYGINFIGDGWIWFWAGIWLGLGQADSIHYYLDLTYSE